MGSCLRLSSDLPDIALKRAPGNAASRIVLYIFTCLLLSLPVVALSPGNELVKVSDFPQYYTVSQLWRQGKAALAYNDTQLANI